MLNRARCRWNGKRNAMRTSIQPCPDCGKLLKISNINSRWFCKSCWEYKDIGDKPKFVWQVKKCRFDSLHQKVTADSTPSES